MTIINMMGHHGSPGSPEDFLSLTLLLPEIHFVLPDRVDHTQSTEMIDYHYQLGYSFGCVNALIEANKNPQTKRIILISPYLYPSKKPGKIIRALLRIPFFKKNILPKIAQKNIQKMLKISSHPKTVPAQYLKDGQQYLEGERLALSILEKNINFQEIEQTINELAQKDIPILVIYGEQDQTSKRNEQLMLLETFSNVIVWPIAQGGHALLWTHPTELSQIIKNILT